MKIVGVIPARYESSRFRGKPLADICGKPMIYYVYKQVKKVSLLDEIYVATDDDKIKDACDKYAIPVVMTSFDNQTPLNRIAEFSKYIDADWYVCINGDEPLIEPEVVSCLAEVCAGESEYAVINAFADVHDPVDVIDFTNLKIVVNDKNEGMYISRSPIPFPKGRLDFRYKKYVGITCLTKEALAFYEKTTRAMVETIEDNDLLRFMSKGIKVKFVDVETNTISVDTPKDLDKVREILKGAEEQQ